MRLWTLHPKYLDSIGLIALWRESLLAKKVLEGKTIGYKNHPQLIRFRESKNSIISINFYLSVIYLESKKRGFIFDKNKIELIINEEEIQKIETTKGQLDYELIHLKSKLKKRSPNTLKKISKIAIIKAHPLFMIVEGNVDKWEKLKK